jgi:FkbM family methyltransferase
MPLAITLPHHPGVLEATGPYPRALNFLNRKQTAVQSMLRRTGLAGYEPITQATLMTLAEQAPRGAAFYDIGAHIGLYSALVDAVFGRGRKDLQVHAFEPTPGTAEVCRSIRKHNRLGFEVHETALGREPGTAELYLSHVSESSNSLNPDFRKPTGSVSVPVTTLDKAAADHTAWPHLMKVDVETLEAAVLDGAMETIGRWRPWIVVELLPSCDRDELRATMDALAGLGYGFHLLQPEQPWGRRGGSYDGCLTNYCRDWLLAPEPLTDGFYRSMRTWLRAILACDETTNLVVPQGSSFPAGWNSRYEPSGKRPRSRAARLIHEYGQRLARVGG